MKKFGLIFLYNSKRIVLFTMVFCVLSSCKSDHFMKHYEKAYLLENDNKYAEAIRELDTVIMLKPTFEQAYLERGIDKGIIYDYEGAIEDLSKLISMRPDVVEPYVWRAENKRFLERYDEALEDLNLALLNKKGLIVQNGEIVGEMEIDYSNPNIVNENFNIELEYIFYEKGASLVHLERDEESLPYLNYCMKNDLNPKFTRNYRGIALLALGYIDDGCEDLLISGQLGVLESEILYAKYCQDHNETDNNRSIK